MGQRLAGTTRAYSQILSVNDRADLALALGAQGLHLGGASVLAERVRARFGARFWLSRASHDPDSCQSLGADAVLLSPVCGPRKGAPSLGLGALARACRETEIPIFALGGVSAENAKACIDAGAAGVAVIGAWLACESLHPLIDALGIARST
jgi:thiamine-phosphate diphosphorylase